MPATAACITLQHPLNQHSIARYRFQIQQSIVQHDFPLHWHTYYELELVLSGEGSQWINGQLLPIGEGSLYMIPPGSLHRLHTAGRLDIISLKIPADGIPPLLRPMLDSWDLPSLCRSEGAAQEAVRSDFLRLQKEMAAPAAGGEACTYGLAALLLAHLRRSDILHADAPAPDRALLRMQTVMEYIQSHFREPITLEAAAEFAGLTPNHLSARFSQVIGCGFSAYVTHLRVEYARRLLAQGDVSITDAAYESGFGSLSHFMRTFKRVCGISPGAYQRNSRSR